MRIKDCIKFNHAKIQCPYCHSPAVVFNKVKIDDDKNKHVESYDVVCSTCNARGNIIEDWESEDNDGRENTTSE